jgi:Na+-driven multidrug efflux pump
MPADTARNKIRLSWRIGLWFAALLVAVTGFALLISSPWSRNLRDSEDLFSIVFRVAMIFAFPVACLYLPLVIALKDAAKRRLWILLISGALIGPVCMAFWDAVLVLSGRESAHEAWYGDPLVGLGTPASMLLALIVGSATTILYVASLRILFKPEQPPAAGTSAEQLRRSAP